MAPAALGPPVARFTRRTRLEAPLEDVVAFHSTVDGLVAVTPGWMNLRVERLRGPDGDTDPDVLEAGTELSLSMRPFGVGPRQWWETRIVTRERGDGSAMFRDVMDSGPFPRWVHTHRFERDGEGTVMTDEVRYQLPLLPGPLSWLGRPFLELLFAYRHRRTRRLLAGGED